jgi:hypothetical protein
MHPLDIALSKCVNGFPDEAEKILREYPDQNDFRVQFNLGWHELRHGNLSKGLRLMDSGRFIGVFGSAKLPGEIWRDQDLQNKTLLFNGENGLGDQILNFRFAKDFKDKGARVVVACSDSLKPIFSRHGFVCVSPDAAPYVYYDYWVPSMSAAHVLGYEQETLSGKQYLTATPKILYGKPSTLKVGIRWAGNPKFEHEQHRKFDPTALFSLHEISQVTLYSLQRDNDLVEGLPFADLRDQMKTFEDTASIIQGLDLVITSCTSIAHLSAALGKETWVIVPVMPYYTWVGENSTSVWYDSVCLFRQKVYGDWSAPLKAVREALEEKVQLKAAA